MSIWCLHRDFTPMFQHLHYRKVVCMLSKEKHKNQVSHYLQDMLGQWWLAFYRSNQPITELTYGPILKMEHIHSTAQVIKNLRFDSLETQGEKRYYCSKKKKKQKEREQKRLKNSDKMIATNILLLYLEISALFTHHQRSFLLKKMGTNTEVQNQVLHRVRCLRTLICKWDVTVNSSPQIAGNPAKEKAEKNIRTIRDGG